MGGEGDAAIEAFNKANEDYRLALNTFRMGVRENYAGKHARCRTDHLAQAAYQHGTQLPQKWLPENGQKTTWGQYGDLMRLLAKSLNDLEACRNMHNVAIWIWQWCAQGYWTLLDQDPAAKSWDHVIELGIDYGHPAIDLQKHWGHPAVKMERVQHVQHVHVLQQASKCNIANDLDQVVEFGGGTGDMAALFKDANFGGSYIVYDMAPMGILQQYWLRYSGHPAYLSKQVQNLPGVKPNAVVLQSAEDDEGFKNIVDSDAQRLKRSAFIAFWSFSEADVDARERIRPVIQGFGRILIAIHMSLDGRYGWIEMEKGKKGVEVASYMSNFVKDHLLATHNVCMWHFKPGANNYPAGGYYFLAVEKTVGPALCLSELGCSKKKLHPSIPSTC